MAYYGTYYAILSAVRDSLAQVLPSSVTLALRKSVIRTETDTLPIVVVAPGEGGERIKEQAFNKVIVYNYPVVVAYLAADNRNLSTGLNTYLQTREQIRNQLYQPLVGASLTGAPLIWDFTIDLDAAFKYQEYFGTNYDVTTWVLWFKSSETRTN